MSNEVIAFLKSLPTLNARFETKEDLVRELFKLANGLLEPARDWTIRRSPDSGEVYGGIAYFSLGKGKDAMSFEIDVQTDSSAWYAFINANYSNGDSYFAHFDNVSPHITLARFP
jgi:hypothetical protein